MSFRTAVLRSRALRSILFEREQASGSSSQLVRERGLLQAPLGTWDTRSYNVPAVNLLPPDKKAVAFPEPVAEETNYCRSLDEYNAFLHQCSQTRVTTRGHLLRDIYGDMLMDGVRPDLKTYQLCITGISRTKHAHDAFFFYNEMKAHGIAAQVAVYNALILAAGRCFELRKAFKTAEEMEANGVKPSVLTYMFLLKVCGDVGRVKEAEGVRQKMVEQGFRMTRFCYVSLINAQKNSRHQRPVPGIIPNIFGLLEEWRQGRDKRMGAEGLSAGATQSAVDKEMADADWAMEDEDLAFDRDDPGRGTKDSRDAQKQTREELAVYNAVLRACLELNYPAGMQKVFQMMKEDTLPPNRETYSALMKYYLSKQDNSIIMAKQMWAEMRALGPISLEIYFDALENTLRKNTSPSIKFASDLLAEFLAEGNYLNMHYGSHLLSLASNANRISDLYMADKIWDAMEKSNFYPKYDAAITYITCLQRQGIPNNDPRMMSIRKIVRQRPPKTRIPTSVETTVLEKSEANAA